MVISSKRVQAPSYGLSAGDLAVGSSVYLMMNGSPVEYMVVNQGNPASAIYDASCDGTWLLMKDIYEERQWHSSNVNDYKNSTIQSYLNSTFLGLLDANIQAVVKEVKIPYVNGTGGSPVDSGEGGLAAKIFLLSGYEIGWKNSENDNIPIDGAKLDYFTAGTTTSAASKRIAYLNGSAILWWLRSPCASGNFFTWSVTGDGRWNLGGGAESYGIRPALILPYSAKFDKDTLVLKG